MTETKPFRIERRQVMEAYGRVAANTGVGGVDGMSLAEFEKDWQNHLYRIVRGWINYSVNFTYQN
jgi:hypothetical protein